MALKTVPLPSLPFSLLLCSRLEAHHSPVPSSIASNPAPRRRPAKASAAGFTGFHGVSRGHLCVFGYGIVTLQQLFEKSVETNCFTFAVRCVHAWRRRLIKGQELHLQLWLLWSCVLCHVFVPIVPLSHSPVPCAPFPCGLFRPV